MENYGMGNPKEFQRAGPTRPSLPRGGWHSLGALSALAVLVVACTESQKKPLTGPQSVAGPNAGLTDPFNAGDKCLAADAFLSGLTSAGNDSLEPANTTHSRSR